jgi:hypothetical protein
MSITNCFTRSCWALLVCTFLSWSLSSYDTRHATAFTVPRHAPRSRAHGHDSVTRRYALQQRPGESRSAFFQRVSQAAADPLVWERMVLEDAQVDGTPSTAPSTGSSSVIPTIHLATNQSKQLPEEKEETTSSETKRGYVRAEEWDKTQTSDGSPLAWEERVQFDGQRYGNKFQQNEILRHNLHSF